MSAAFLSELFVQCCDADDYLEIGKQCAEQSVCYGDLRPGGAYYWFSWPARLGLSSTAFVWANFFLIILSALLAARVLLLTGRRFVSANAVHQYLSAIAIGFACLAIHLIFFLPTVFTTLSDPPSSLFLLIGIWLLLLTCLASEKRQSWLIIFAGLCLGGAAWIRAFYLYPVLVGVCIGSIAIIASRKRLSLLLLLPCCLIFPGYQLLKIYQNTGSLTYLKGDMPNYWTNIHLKSTEIGYDTLLKYGGYHSKPHYCQINSGLLASVQQRDYASFLCLLGNRAAFYLATYRATTLITPRLKNQLDLTGAEEFGVENSWLRFNLALQQNVAADPAGGMNADKMTALAVEPYGGTYAIQMLLLPGNADYTFSVWLWSDQPTQIQLHFSQLPDSKPLASSLASLSKQPQRFFVSGKTADPNPYSVIIGTPSSTEPVVFGSSLNDSIYVWGAQLEAGSAMTQYAGLEFLDADDIRPWHPWLLFANSLALILALLMLLRFRKSYVFEPTGLMAISIICAVFAEALMIIPEQRFCAAFMVFIWVITTGFMISFMAKITSNRLTTHQYIEQDTAGIYRPPA